MAEYRIVDGESEIGWLLDRGNVASLDTGLQVPGFEARVLVLHSMREHPEGEGSLSFDVARRAAIEGGELQPTMIGDVNLEDISVATGLPGGSTAAHAGWRRLRWCDLADRWGVELALDSVNPISAFRPKLESGSWPVGIQPPAEGSLDWEALVRLVAVLDPFTGSQLVFAYSAPDAWYGPHRETGSPPLTVGPLRSLLDLYRGPGSFGSGQNWWPADHSWLVYTDWDLTYTVVQGTAKLAASLLDDAELETARLDPL